MLRIRLQRIGRRKLPFFRIVVAEKARGVKNKFLEILGFFNPATKQLELKKERALHWIGVGAQPTDRVARMLAGQGMSECEKFIATRTMKPSRAEREAAEKAEKEAQEKAEAEKAAAAAKESEPAADEQEQKVDNKEPAAADQQETPAKSKEEKETGEEKEESKKE